MAKKKDERSMDEITDAILLNDEPGIDVTDDEDALIDELAALIDGDDEPIEKAAKSMFGPGKNPKSHGNTKGKGKGGLATSRTGKINRLSSGDKKQMSNWGDAADRNSEDASSARSMKREGRGYIETSRFHIAEARKALLSGDKAKATKHAYEARYSTREARQYDEGSGDRNNPGGGLRVPKDPNEKKSAPAATPKPAPKPFNTERATKAKMHLSAARRAKTGGNLGKASYHAQEARKEMRGARGTNWKGLNDTTGAKMHANAIGEAKFGLSFPKMKDSSMANAKKWRDKARVTKSQPGPGDVHASGADPKAGHMAGCRCKDCRKKVAKGYAVGKNPNSHKGRGKVDAARDGRVVDRAPKGQKGLAKKQLSRARQHMAEARKTTDGADRSWRVEQARKLVRWARGSHDHLEKRITKGYAVGKNPNSHKKRQSANRGDKLPKGTPIQDQANRALRASRKALNEGDKGKASHYAHEARTITRVMRGRVATGRSGGGVIDTTGIKQTEGDKAHNRARWNENAVKANMKAARSETGETRSASVRRARGANRQGRKFRAISRVTKRFEIPVKIQKADKKEQIVYGWASPVSEFGTSIIDKQGDVLDIDDVRKAAHDFMLNSRSGGSMHKDIGIDRASVVESVVLSTELQKALGIDMPYEGWFIGVKIHDNAVWKKIEDGEYTGFSIGGSGVREAMEETVEKKSMYGPGKNPNSHKRSGRAKAFESVMRGNPASPRNSAAVGKVKQHLNESKNWLAEAREVRGHDPKQAAYAAQQARKELRRARGSSTKTDSGKSLQARRARSFARQSRDERD
jgi:hypothetical protein